MIYHFKVHKEGTAYWAECFELKGCQTEGDTMDELEKNASEALHLYLQEPAKSKMVFPLPKKSLGKKSNVISVPVDAELALAVYLRALRHRRRMTQRQAATVLGYKEIWKYQKLESPRGSNPTLKTLATIAKKFPGFSVDDILEG